MTWHDKKEPPVYAALPVLAQPGDRVARVNARADGSIRAEDAVTYDHEGRKVTWPPDSAWDESDDELSPAAAAALAAGIESAKRGEIQPLDPSWMAPAELGDFDDQ